MEDFTQGKDFILRPLCTGAHAREGDQFLVGAGAREEKRIKLCFLREITILVPGDDSRIIRARCTNAGDVSLNITGFHRLHDGDALIAFDDVVIAQVFKRCDRLVDTFRFDAVIEMIPLGGKLAAAVKDRQEVLCESAGAPH